MARCRPHCTESRYDNLNSGGGGGGSSISWNTVTLAAGDLVQAGLNSVLASVSYGSPFSFTTTNVDPGSIGGGTDCPLWKWTIASPMSFTDNSQVLLQMKFTSGVDNNPTTTSFLVLGLYDNTVGVNRGLYGAINTQNGNTATGNMGSNPSNGSAAAEFYSAGGSMEVAFNLDADLGRPRDILIRSKSNTGPAYGEQGNGSSSPGNFSGTNLQGFFGIQTNNTDVLAAGTYSGIEIRWAIVPRYA